jgi:hypothetical protein
LERRDPSQLLGEDEDEEMEVAESVGSEEEESDSDESSEAVIVKTLMIPVTRKRLIRN